MTDVRALVLDPACPEDCETLERLARTAVVLDVFPRQLEELVAVRAPGRSDRSAMQACLGAAADRLRRWVYYPWRNQLVGVLRRDEFREVRLSRNRPKITAVEQRRLADATIAVAGLSVGSGIVTTMAMEGIGGHWILADGDTIELSNLNRLAAGLSDLGTLKAVFAARRLAEIDPWFTVELLCEPLTAATFPTFLRDAASAPDLVVEETDDLRLKRRLREAARARGIPVLMETASRGLLDIERFDLEPYRPILHGRFPTNTTGRIETVRALLGDEGLSSRIEYALAQVGKTLTSWPQLASEIALGSASVTTAARRILLGQSAPSGRRSVDLEDVIATVFPKLSGSSPGVESGPSARLGAV